MTRIKINLDKKYLYICHREINEKLDFKDIKELSIIQEYNEEAFKFRIVTNNLIKEVDYNKYLNQNITEDQRKEIKELKMLINKASQEIKLREAFKNSSSFET